MAADNGMETTTNCAEVMKKQHQEQKSTEDDDDADLFGEESDDERKTKNPSCESSSGHRKNSKAEDDPGKDQDDGDSDADLLDSLLSDDEEQKESGSVGLGESSSKISDDGKTSENKVNKEKRLLLEELAMEQATDVFLRERKAREEKLERLELNMSDAEAQAAAKAKAQQTMDERTEKFSGLRLRERYMPVDVLERNMAGRQFVKLGELNESLLANMANRAKKDWVIIGVLVKKTVTPPDQAKIRNMPRSRWIVSDLSAKRTFITLSLYDDAHYKHFDRTPLGTVVLLYEPSVKAAKSTTSKTAFYLSVSLESHIMQLGTSYDYGLCNGVGYNGELCTEVINTRSTRFCPKHASSELSNIRSSRMMLHSSSGVKVSQPVRGGNSRDLSSTMDDENKTSDNQQRSGKRKLSVAEQLRQAREKKLAQENSKRKAGPGNAVVLADGTVSVQHDDSKNGAKKAKKEGPISDRANAIVSALNSNLRKHGANQVTQQTSKGLRRAYAAITGTDIQAQGRTDGAMQQREYQRAMNDPLKAATLAQNRNKNLASVGAMTSRVGALHRRTDGPNAVREAAELANSLDPKLQSKIKSSSQQPIGSQSGRFGVNEEVVRRRNAEQRVVDERARMQYNKQQRADQMKKAVNDQKKAHVMSLLKNSQSNALSSHDMNSTRLRDIKRVQAPAPASRGRDVLLGLTSQKARMQSQARSGISRPNMPAMPSASSFKTGSANASLGLGNPHAGKPDIVISLKQSLDSKSAQEVLRTKSKFQDAGNHAKANALQNTLRGLASAEDTSNRKAQLMEMKVKAFICHDCGRTTEEVLPRCKLEEHETSELTVTKRFFKCAKPDCGERTFTLGPKTCRQPCPGCSGIRWVPCSAYSDKTLGIHQRKATKDSTYEAPTTTFNHRGG
mmetsp:Transcript_4165/g.9037  ORF Transcript_4165/g.9037 Transcript_4165/m.9037 type:complete len:904 (+) Transcript_4165:130-2841(+)